MSLFEHGQIRTTLPKAKDLRPFAERLITLAKRARQGNLQARRRLHKLMTDRSYIPAEHRDSYAQMSDAKRKRVLKSRSGRRHRTDTPKGKLDFTAGSIAFRLIETIAPRYEDRPGGYTRIIRLADRRIGDSSELAVIQLVGDQPGPGSVTKPRKSARKTRADARYAAAIKATKKKTSQAKAAPKAAEKPAEPEQPSSSADEAGDVEST